MPSFGNNTTGDGTQIVVFNPLSWSRTGVVEVNSPFNEDVVSNVIVTDGKIPYPAQIVADKIIFTARNVPALECKAFRLMKSDKPTGTSIKTGRDYIENEFFRVKIDLPKGSVKSIYDKVNKRELVPRDKQTGVLQIVFGERIKSLDNADESEILETGPTRAMVRLEHSCGKSSFVQDIVLYEGLPRIDIKITADWQEEESGLATTLKVIFPTALSSPEAAFDAPCRTTPQKWIDLSEEKYGVSILNHCKYACSITDNVMSILIPTEPPDQRIHEAAFSIYPHSGDWSAACTSRYADELYNPLNTGLCLCSANYRL